MEVNIYEEQLNQDILNHAICAIEEADMLIIGGTSLVVYPAAGLINYFSGKYLVQINKTATSADSMADLTLNEDIAMVMENALKLM